MASRVAKEPIIRPHKSKRARIKNKKWIGRTIHNSAAVFWQIWTKRAQKGPKLNKIDSLLLPFLIQGKCPRNIFIFPLTQTKIVFFFSPNSFRKENYWRTEFFLSRRSNFSSVCIGRKVLRRVGNTDGQGFIRSWSTSSTAVVYKYSCTVGTKSGCLQILGYCFSTRVHCTSSQCVLVKYFSYCVQAGSFPQG